MLLNLRVSTLVSEGSPTSAIGVASDEMFENLTNKLENIFSNLFVKFSNIFKHPTPIALVGEPSLTSVDTLV